MDSETDMRAAAESPRHRSVQSRPPDRKWRVPWGALAASLVVVAGIVILLYPQAASWFSSKAQSRIIVQDLVDMGEMDRVNAAAFEEAREYNEMLVSGGLVGVASVAPGGNVPTADGGAEAVGYDYDELLDASGLGIMGRLRVDSAGVDLPVYHGTSDETLLKGVGHLKGTALPVGGVGTRSVLTGHRGLATSTLFTNLDKVEIGDDIVLEVSGEVLQYRVRDIQVVEPNDGQAVLPEPGKDLVTLITCTPLGINTHRILVTGERVTPTEPGTADSAGATPAVPGFPWWAVILSGGLLVAGTYVWRSGYPPKPKKS